MGNAPSVMRATTEAVPLFARFVPQENTTPPPLLPLASPRAQIVPPANSAVLRNPLFVSRAPPAGPLQLGRVAHPEP